MQQWCLCADIPDVDNETGVLVLRHGLEARKTTNTSRYAQMALRKIEILDWDVRTKLDAGAWLADKGLVWLLYPGGSTAKVGVGKPDALLVIDGTWKQARKLLHTHPSLLSLPRLSLPAPDPTAWRLRMTKHRDAQSSLEAIAEGLRLVDGDAPADALQALHTTLVQQVLLARGAIPGFDK